MVRAMQFVAALSLTTGISASQIEERDSCPSGFTHMAGLALIGGTFDVCCPGKSVEVDNVAYCCVGNKDDNDNKKRKICIGSSDNCDVEDSKTATCVTAVPATANDFSNRVSQATATMTGQILPTDNAAPAMITAAPWAPWVAVAGGAMANAALFV